MDKFRWRMFVDYARFFYAPNGEKKTIRDKTGFYKPMVTGDQAYDLAWFGHTRRAKHHWQYWCLQDNAEKSSCFRIPPKYVLEMFCDWLGAGRAQGTPDVVGWWKQNKSKMLLHPETAYVIAGMIGGYAAGLPVRNVKQIKNRYKDAAERNSQEKKSLGDALAFEWAEDRTGIS